MIDRESCILLNMISGIGYAKYSRLVEAFGSPDKIFRQSFDRLREVPGIGDLLAERIAEVSDGSRLKTELAMAERAGVRIITLTDPDYPEQLRELHDPPLCIYLRGMMPEFSNFSVAVVGSRRMSRYGERMTRSITEVLASSGCLIVSGLAAGVDTVAHHAAVNSGGLTAAVLGGGLMRLYPAENAGLARRIIESGGALISEFPLEFPVSRTSFPRRNRIVAALSSGILVTEAGIDSGALITASLGVELGREIMAVPGMADNPQAAGCHKLIKEGAALVENAGDVLALLDGGLFAPGHLRSLEIREKSIPYDAGALSGLPLEVKKVFELLSDTGKTMDELLSESGMDTGVISGALMRLELLEMIRKDAAGVYEKVSR